MGVQINGDTGNISATKADYSGNVTIGGTLTYEDVTNIDSVGLVTARTGIEIGARPGVAASISVDGNMIVSGVSTFGGESFINDTLNITGNLNIADKIIHTGDTNTSIRFPSPDEVTVETAGTERLSIEPAGNVNIPKSVNVGAAITVGSATSTSTFVGEGFIELTRSAGNSYIDFKDAFTEDYDARIITSANQLQFFTGGQGATVTSFVTGTGKLGISTDTLPTVAKLQIHSDKLGATAGNTQELLYMLSPDIYNSTTYRFTNYRHTNGTSHTQSEGRLRRHVDVTDQGFIGFGDNYIRFGYGTSENFLYIKGDGRIGINNTSPAEKLEVSYGHADVGIVVSTTDTFASGNSTLMQFREVNTVGGSIAFTNGGTTTAYVTSSDYRLKENVVTLTDAITRLKTLKPYRFNFIKTPDTTVDGFLAHEVTAIPEAVIGEKDAMQKIKYTESDELPEGKNVGDFKEYSTTEIDPQGVDYSKLTPLLTAALQEAIAKIETLEAEVAALKG